MWIPNFPRSVAIHFRPSFSATAAVVPEPTKKSATRSPSLTAGLDYSLERVSGFWVRVSPRYSVLDQQVEASTSRHTSSTARLIQFRYSTTFPRLTFGVYELLCFVVPHALELVVTQSIFICVVIAGRKVLLRRLLRYQEDHDRVRGKPALMLSAASCCSSTKRSHCRIDLSPNTSSRAHSHVSG